DAPLGRRHEACLPRITTPERAARARVSERGIRSLNIELMHHPGWCVEHPLEVEGRAVRLWPPPNHSVDIAKVPTVGNHSLKWVEGFELTMSEEQLAHVQAHPLGPPLEPSSLLAGGLGSAISLGRAPHRED